MSDLIVVCFRANDLRINPREYLRSMRALSEQAAAMGGKLLSWGSAVMSFAFPNESLEDAVELAVSVALDSVPGQTFGIGISEGPLERIEDATSRSAISWGPALVRATALARSARTSEVLVDPVLGAVRRGEILTQGARLGVHGKERLRGLILDLRHPWRSDVADLVASLERPKYMGHSELTELMIQGGTLGVVRADRGHGGTRLLEELEEALRPARALRMAPHALGEPLGALRRCILRAVNAGHTPLGLDDKIGPSIARLLAGEGLDPDATAELIVDWLTPDAPHDPSGIVIIDDADEVDVDTLEAVSRAALLSNDPFRLIIRIPRNGPVPRALSAIRVETELRLGPLAPADAVRLAQACTRGELEERAAERWAHRGGGVPLDVVESIHEALESGELVWEDGRATGRFKGAGAGVARPAKYWLRRRFDYLDSDAQRTLQALAIFGGECEEQELTSLVEGRYGQGVDVATARAVLEASGWVRRVSPDLIALTNTSQRNAVLSTLSEESFGRWHVVASEVVLQDGRPLSLPSAAVHAALGGDVERAEGLARRATDVVRAIGLEKTAEAFEQLATSSNWSVLVERNLLRPHLEREVGARPSSAPPPPMLKKRSSSVPPSTRDDPSYAPLPPSLRPPAMVTINEGLGGPSRTELPLGEPTRRAPPLIEEEDQSDSEMTTVRRPRTDALQVPTDGGKLKVTSSRPPITGNIRVSEPPISALDALRAGDAEAVERLAEQLRLETGRVGLAERLQAMAYLARGQTGDALRRLREAAEVAKKSKSADQCRTLLALAVALSAAHRSEEALLAGLEGLARARDVKDERGEQACARFIARLTKTAGHPELAEAWDALAEG